MTAQDTPQIIRNDGAGRFEVADAPQGAFLAYRQEDGRLTLEHTEVADDLEGHGLGSALVRAAIDYADGEQLAVVPACPFVADWLDRHPDRAARLDIVTQ